MIRVLCDAIHADLWESASCTRTPTDQARLVLAAQYPPQMEAA